MPTRPLSALVDYWRLMAEDGLPCLSEAEPDRLQVLPGRIHLVRVERDAFRFLHYGAAVTNPDARDMCGLTTRDYEDHAFGELVTAHYAEGVSARRPVCRAIRAAVDGDVYDYVRVVAPFGLGGDSVEFLVIGTERIAVPARCERAGDEADPETLRATLERTKRLARQISGTEAGVALAGIAAAAALHFSEAMRMAALRRD
ncbi:hypothetical protein [uncultured Alsobacter sp.]|uniref:hypothetical protein n=1 Tax=uncultured Alsobacter sp. TaxID=1748258 RepID=UPI0025E5AE97|nr:hypothetical protein [uncultured Alsobacter sp.]